MEISPLAGKPADRSILINVPRLVTAYYTGRPDPSNGWFAARPSGTENIYKIYAESFKDENHLAAIVEEAQEIVTDALRSPDAALHEQEVH